MACFWFDQNNCKIEIPCYEEIGNVTYYKIKIFVGDFNWIVSRRYSEFFDLHNQLVSEHGISKDILPSKKVIRNKSPAFIESRRKGLQEYLEKIFVFLKQTMPKVFTNFLRFEMYDIFFLLHELSAKLFLEADLLLVSGKPYSFLTLEVHAVSEFLRKPLPSLENAETKIDAGPVLDFCSQLESLSVSGNSASYIDSNIVLNKLPFELSMFKNVKNVYLKNIAPKKIFSLGNLRNTAVTLQLNETDIRSICEILQCDVIHKQDLKSSQIWECLEKLDLSNNNITEIDVSITLLPNLKELILNDNKISSISNLSSLPKLSSLSLSNNLISICPDLHTKIGNVITLNLSQNQITSCKGFAKLYSLENFDVSFNRLNDIDEAACLGELPCLENLVLTGNGLATTVDYRTKVLEYFGERAKSICLDNEKASQAELDKVSVFRALRIVKEGKTPNLKNNSFS